MLCSTACKCIWALWSRHRWSAWPPRLTVREGLPTSKLRLERKQGDTKMPNESGNAYALTVLSPIVNGYHGEISHASETERRLLDLDLDEKSPMAKVPQTYLARFFVLHDVYYENAPE